MALVLGSLSKGAASACSFPWRLLLRGAAASTRQNTRTIPVTTSDVRTLP